MILNRLHMPNFTHNPIVGLYISAVSAYVSHVSAIEFGTSLLGFIGSFFGCMTSVGCFGLFIYQVFFSKHQKRRKTDAGGYDVVKEKQKSFRAIYNMLCVIVSKLRFKTMSFNQKCFAICLIMLLIALVVAVIHSWAFALS